MIDYLEHGSTINGVYYTDKLRRFPDENRAMCVLSNTNARHADNDSSLEVSITTRQQRWQPKHLSSTGWIRLLWP